MIKEKKAFKVNGFLAILICIVLIAAMARLTYFSIEISYESATRFAVIAVILVGLLVMGIKIVQPNQTAVLTFFGKYTGCISSNGFWFVIPFSMHRTVSKKVRNFNSEKLKVNDVNGNPIEIAAVVVFKVVDAAMAVFDVDHYEKFVEIQSETALRHVAAKYPYDNFDKEILSLRGNADEVSKELLQELQDRLSLAGVEMIETRLTHLAYATEIASAMLQRQQASAILSARQIIVDGAVGMAQMAVDSLEKEGLVTLDNERKMQMINNVMVSIIADRSSQPVINIGSLY